MRRVTPKVLTGTTAIRREHPEDMRLGPVRSQGRAARCVIRNWPHVLSAPDTPVIRNERRVVIGIRVGGAEKLADFPGRDEGARRVQIP
jgi:hypothetical protein